MFRDACSRVSNIASRDVDVLLLLAILANWEDDEGAKAKTTLIGDERRTKKAVGEILMMMMMLIDLI